MTGYREIAAQLRAAIESGQYPPGSQLPTEHDLAAQHGVSRETVRRALAVLKAAGLLTSATKQGTTVARPPVRLEVAHYAAAADPDRPGRELGPWETACAEQGVAGRADVVDVAVVPAPPAVAARFGVAAGTALVRRTRRMYAGDDLAQLQESYVLEEIAAGTPLAGEGKLVGGLYAAARAAGVDLADATEEIAARLPTAAEQDALGLPDAAWVLETWRATRDQGGRVVEVLHSVSDARRVARVYGALPIG
ncbi:GntR family transcriptional regulator [Micromonospora sp. WMMD718]|uniref:GntR family transcriptional regulator n=1 Tax=Micromonospora TaxID=1873 RepID=UPI001657148D|nr:MULTISPECIES: GntR family transcriptional regulator [Micromonospora]MBC9001309.1 GntR family transcriptional regulator [Micromonospora aurantiaca]MDG4756033.1 GntR family transcriptional regulator [Micromonospora sp. WMMD718]MDG4756087.1 GntR family transcriptional regulator [Micromonospora sp. WMMD718]